MLQYLTLPGARRPIPSVLLSNPLIAPQYSIHLWMVYLPLYTLTNIVPIFLLMNKYEYYSCFFITTEYKCLRNLAEFKYEYLKLLLEEGNKCDGQKHDDIYPLGCVSRIDQPLTKMHPRKSVIRRICQKIASSNMKYKIRQQDCVR